MKLAMLSLREQVIMIAAAAVVAGGGYALLRGVPLAKETAAMHAEILQTEDRLLKEELPELPDEDMDQLARLLKAAESELEAIKIEAAEIETRLAPVDSQELQLLLSDLAMESGVRIRVKQAHVVRAGQAGVATGAAGNPRRATRREATRAARAARQNAQASAAQNPVTPAPSAPAVPVPATTISPPGGVHDLMSRMALGTEYQRPMQSLTLEGGFEGVHAFIRGLETLPWLVTVLQMEIEAVKQREGQRGPQWVTAKLILQL